MTMKLILLIAACIVGGETAGWIDLLPNIDMLWKWLQEDPEQAAIFQVMALYDTKARMYRLPFFVPHTDVGLRAVRAAVNEAGSELAKFAEDFLCHHIGSFNDENANFEAFSRPFNFGCIAVLKAPDTVTRDYATEQRPFKEGSEVKLPLGKLVQPGEE